MRFRTFVEKMKVSQDRDVDELPGTQPSKYYKGVDKDEKEKRAKQFARQAKMSDDDPRAYKPAPGDKEAKTKPSKHTNKFKQMYGERALTPAEKDKMKEYEKKIDKKDFIDRYGEEEGERIYYATITKMAKKNEGENVAAARERIKREKEADKEKHDAMLDRARTADTRSNNIQEAVSPAQQAAIAIAKKKSGKYDKDGNRIDEADKDKMIQHAVDALKQVWKRKEKNAKHSIDYYAAQVARGYRGINARDLVKMVQEDDDPCWNGYKQVGMKKKNGKMVPNCVQEEVSQKQIDDLEKFADRLLAKFKVDVEFTKHFKDRMNDKRNSPEIKVVELQKLFKKIQKNKAKNIQGNAGLEAVLKDLSSDLNLPVVIKQKGDEIELVNKTIMRKPDFKTTSKIIKYEEFTNMDEASRADMRIRKRPHMMLKAGNAGVKFDGRFKMFKKKQMLHDDEKPLKESVEDLSMQVFDLMESTENAITEDSGEALKKKADKTGMPLSILKKVFDRGVAAWRTGHRPGTTATQWGLARVNSFVTKSKGTWGGADQDLAKKVRNEEMNEGKSSTGYELYHKDFSSAMQHAYKHAKDKLKIEIDPEEIDNKVATGPRKPSKGKTNTYRLTDKSGKKAVHIQVANLDNKRYELNMYKESTDLDAQFESLVEEDLQENSKHKKAIEKAHKFFVKTSKGRSDRIQEKNRFAAMEMLKKELEKMGASESDMMKAFGELDKHIVKTMDESVEQLDELREPFIVYDPENGNEVVGTASDEKGAKGIISSAGRPPMSHPNPKALKIAKSRKKQHIGRKLNASYCYESLDENMSRAAKELETYARKNGGIDKMDFMKAAMMMKKGQTNQLKKFVDDLDTEPREKILSLMQKDADRRKEYKAAQKKMRGEQVELEEGVNDPGIFKAVFLAGGPGSGKSFMVGKTALTTLGLKLINSDPAFEAQLKKVGLKATPEDIFTPKGQDARAKAKRLTAKQQELALNGRLGLVIDGTGKDYAKIEKQAIALKKLGYEVGMIFVNTNLETAIARDAKRDRTLGAKEVTKMWNEVQDNIGKFQKFFGTGMLIVDNSDGADWQSGSTNAYKKMSAWVKKPVKSPVAKKWIDAQKQQRGITEEDSKKLEESKKPLEYGTQETTDTFKKATPGEGAPQRFTQRIRESILRSRRRR